MPVSKDLFNSMVDRPKTAAEIYADKAPKPEAKRRYFRCVDCAKIVAPKVVRCKECADWRRQHIARGYGKKRAPQPVRITGEAFAQLSGKTDSTVRCSDCRLPQPHCKCNRDIPEIKRGYKWN